MFHNSGHQISNISHWARSRCQQVCIPSERSRGESVSYTFPASRKSTCILWFIDPLLHLQTNSVVSSNLCFTRTPHYFVKSSFLTLTFLLLSFQAPFDYIGPTEIIQENFPISRLFFVTSAKFLLPCKKHIYKFWGLGYLWGAIILCAKTFHISNNVLISENKLKCPKLMRFHWEILKLRDTI